MLLSAGLSVVGGLVGAVGQLQAANANARAEDYNAQVAEHNADVANRNRATILAQSDNEAADQVRENRARMASIRAAYGASGIDLEGSALDVLNATAIENTLDVKRIQYAGALQAAGQVEEANSYKSQAELSRMGAASSKTAGRISAVGSFFGGLSEAGSSLLKRAA